MLPSKEEPKKQVRLTKGMPWACCPGMVGTGLPVARIFWWCSISFCRSDVSCAVGSFFDVRYWICA